MTDTPPSQPQPNDALGTLIARVYPDLRRMAAARAAGTGCSPSSLAQEAVCRLLRLPEPPMSEDGARAVGFKMMEWTLLDKVRSDASRRVREAATTNHNHEPAPDNGHEPLDHLAHALRELADLDPRKAEVLTLSALCGMTAERIADVLQVSAKTVQRDLAFSRAWIVSRVRRDDPAAATRNGSGHT